MSIKPQTAKTPVHEKYGLSEKNSISKHSKEDLIRLLSVLQGELEAQDIYISSLLSELRQSELKKRYFVHDLQNPFSALLRDDLSISNVNKDRFKAKVGFQPLEILDQILKEFKAQHKRMHQQLIMSRKYQKIMADELNKEKEKNVEKSDTSKINVNVEEKFKATIASEKMRVKQAKLEYKNLLKICNVEREKYRTIITMLLCDKEKVSKEMENLKNQSKGLKSNNGESGKETEIQVDLAKLLCQTQNERDRLVDENSLLKNRVTRLELALKMHKIQLAAKAQSPAAIKQDENHSNNVPIIATTGCTTPLTAYLSKNGQATSNDHTRVRNDSLRVVQGSQDVTLVPSSSHPPMMLAAGSGEVTTSGYYSVKSTADNVTSNSIPNMKSREVESNNNNMFLSLNNTITSKPKSLFLSAPSIPPKTNKNMFLNLNSDNPISSPNPSVAANFALNSPNMPNPPLNSPFSTQNDKNIKRITSAQFQAVRQKFQSSNSTSNMPTPKKTELNQSSTSRSPAKNIGSSYSPTILPNPSNNIHPSKAGPKPVPPPKNKALLSNERPPPLPPKRLAPVSSDENENNPRSEITRRRPASAKASPTTSVVQVKPRRNVSLKRVQNNENGTKNESKSNYPTPPARPQAENQLNVTSDHTAAKKTQK